jgi:hypothetical protein
MRPCPVCLKPATIEPIKAGVRKVSCERCGEYRVNAELERGVDLDNEKRYILSGIVRNRFEQGVPTHITTENVQALLDSMAVPSDPIETIDWLLNYLQRKASKASEYVPINPATGYPILFAKDTSELQYYLQKAEELKYIEPEGNAYRPNTKGWRRLIDLRKEERKSNQAFVAMWFKPDHPYLGRAYENGFEPALKATGYKPIKMDWVEHDEKICDMIIGTIRKSGLLVADVTGHRENVYFEAGFAMGLGIHVIWTCHKADIELPFDTRQYNHIFWSDSKDLKERLIKRIEAMP